jgi:hypothetical protein
MSAIGRLGQKTEDRSQNGIAASDVGGSSFANAAVLFEASDRSFVALQLLTAVFPSTKPTRFAGRSCKAHSLPLLHNLKQRTQA